MTVDTVKSAAMVYQGSASNAANQSRKISAEPAQPVKPIKIEAESSKPVIRESENFDVSQKSQSQSKNMETPDVLDAAEKNMENEGVQQNSRQLQDAVEKLKKNLSNTEAVFGIHEGTKRVMIKIVDKETKDVIKEYPPEKTLDMIQKVWEMAGIMVDEKL